MTPYDYDSHYYSPPNIVIRYVHQRAAGTPSPIRVLDLGCNKGYVGSHLKTLGPYRVYGMDMDEDDIQEASRAYDGVMKVDLDTVSGEADLFGGMTFDVALCLDVLEHLKRPERVLKAVRRQVRGGGLVCVSLPNVAHLWVRMNLLAGRFNYTNTGILDKTHLHLYTRASGRTLVEGAGIKVTQTGYASNRFGGILRRMPVLGSMLGFNLLYFGTPDTTLQEP